MYYEKNVVEKRREKRIEKDLLKLVRVEKIFSLQIQQRKFNPNQTFIIFIYSSSFLYLLSR